MAELEQIAPRLARAHAAEREYQRRKTKARRQGILPLDIATEEMIRSFRLMYRHMAIMRRRLADPARKVRR